MNRLLTLLALCLLVLPAPLMAASWWRTITVEWTYAPPVEPAVDGFQLYVGAAKACRFEGADTRTGMCDVLLPAPSTAFTITATFADGSESPHSAPFEFTDTVPAPVINTITR